MKDKHREQFTNRGKPDEEELGPELTSQLPTNLSNWLRDTYAPAFITRNVSQIEKFRDRFKAGETDRTWYWWSDNVS